MYIWGGRGIANRVPFLKSDKYDYVNLRERRRAPLIASIHRGKNLSAPSKHARNEPIKVRFSVRTQHVAVGRHRLTWSRVGARPTPTRSPEAERQRSRPRALLALGGALPTRVE